MTFVSGKPLFAYYLFPLVVWNVYGECENIGVLSGHSGAVMELHFSTDGNFIFTCSTDTTLGMWDLEKGQRVKKLKGEFS